MSADIPEGLRDCSNCMISEEWELTVDRLHYVICKSCRACLLGKPQKGLPYPFKGWMPKYKAGTYRWLKQANDDICPKNGEPVRQFLRGGNTCDGCDYHGKMSYISGDDMITVRCHYVLDRDCSNCKKRELTPISKVC